MSNAHIKLLLPSDFDRNATTKCLMKLMLHSAFNPRGFTLNMDAFILGSPHHNQARLGKLLS